MPTPTSARADRYEEIAKFKDTPFQSAFAAVKHAKITLEAGFTTIRDLGGRPFLAVDLRDVDRRGFHPRAEGGGQRAGDLDHGGARRPE